VEEAHELATEALALSDRTGNVPLLSVLASVLGFLALSVDDHQAVHSYLCRLASASAAVGLGEPSGVKFLPDEIEAPAALGESDLARSFTHQLEARGKSLGRRWALATGARCRAHLAAIDGDLREALAAVGQALSHHERLPMPFELGRTLLVKGMVERRGKLRSVARDSFGQAMAIFEQLGAPLWADKARRELSKMAMSGPPTGLTETESRIAALVVQGQTNRRSPRRCSSRKTPCRPTSGTSSRSSAYGRGLSSRHGCFPHGEAILPAARLPGDRRRNITDSGDSSACARN
jgi:hypothetical protein